MSAPDVPRPAAGPHRARHRPVVPAQHLAPVGVDGGLVHTQQADHVGMGAEAAVAHGDPVFGAQPGGHQGVVHALDGERRRPAACRRRHARPTGPSRRTPSIAARPPRSRSASARSCAMTASQPRAPSASTAACRAMAPTTLGEPASSRSGGAVQITSSRSTRSTAPPPARNGSPGLEEPPGADQGAGPERGVELVPAQGQEVGVDRQGPVRRELGGVDQHRHAPGVGRGDDLRQRRQPAGDVRGAGDGQQGRAAGPGVEGGGHVVHVEGPVRAALHVAARRPPGPRAAGWRGARPRWSPPRPPGRGAAGRRGG